MSIDAALAGTLPELRDKEKLMRAQATAEGIAYVVADYGAVRTQADTNTILGYRDKDYAAYVAAAQRAGKTPVSKNTFRPIAPFGSSYHNAGAAFDARIIGFPAAKMTGAQAVARLGAIGEEAGLRWGGHFPPGSVDEPHFELAISLPDAAARWKLWQAAQHAPQPPNAVSPVGILPVIVPGVQMATAALPVTAAAQAAVTTGAIIAASLLVWVVVQRMTGGR